MPAAAAARADVTISVDTGGTFTDAYISSPGSSSWVKADTTPHDLTIGVIAAIDSAASDRGVSRTELLRRTASIRLSTTIGTNTLINRSGAAVGLLAGPGIADAVNRLPANLPLDRSLLEVVPDDPSGHDDPAILRAVHRLLERGARIVVVALAEGGDLAGRETRLRDIVMRDYPRHYLGAVPILPSHQVTMCPDGAVRVASAVIDAYFHPVMSRFLYRVEDELRRSGYPWPLLIGNADGGTSRVAKTSALRTWGSGPAGGVAGAVELARHLGLAAVVAVDVGGTSSDISVIRDAAWRYAVQPAIEGIEVSLPVLDLASIGVGGGSIVTVRDGEIHVGPESAGAYPGPAAFGLGGEDATVTDGAAAAGLFDPANFLGGRKTLDLAAACAAVSERVGEPLGLATGMAGRRIVSAAAAEIGRNIRERLAAFEVDPAAAALFATGGAGGLIAVEAAAAAGLDSAYVFPISPVFSAFGLSALGVQHSYETRPGANPTELAEALAALRRRALEDMRGEGLADAPVTFAVEVERIGADGTVRAETLDPTLDQDGIAVAVHSGPDAARLVRLRALVPADRRPPAWVPAPPAAGGTREVFWDAAPRATPVHAWESIEAGSTIVGPGIVESRDTTVAVPPGCVAVVGNLGELHLRRAQPRGDGRGRR